MKTLIFMVFTFAIISSFEIEEAPKADDRVLIELYSESLCPDCLNFILKSLKTALNTKDIYLISEFKMYPYGNARWAKNGSGYTFTCQHGVRQCEGNVIQTCALNLYDQHTQAFPFILCLESNTTNWNTQGAKCATQYGLNWTAISQCSTTSQGNLWEYQMAVATDKLNPAHTYVPWITVNGAHNLANQNAIISNMVSFICKNYKGTIKIAACP